MKYRPFIYFFLVCILYACGEGDAQKEIVETSKPDQQDQEITINAIERLKYDDYVLSDQAIKAVANWQKFQELANNVSYLKAADLSFFKSDKQVLLSLMTDLKKEIPEIIDTKPVNARILALETKLYKLQNYLTLSNIKTEDKLQGIKDLFVAMSHLNLQINKKLEFDANDVERPE